MKTLALIILSLSLALAQEKPAAEKPAAEAATPADAKPAEEKAAETPAAEGAAAPEAPIRGSVEVGYRMLGDVHGNMDTYRSVVNLGEGPRLLNLDLSMSPSLKWIDDLSVRANSWGGDPYNTAYLRAGKQNLYRLDVDYRNIAYFNALPSFANPRIETGMLFNQRSYDMKRRFAEVNLDILRWGKIVPFFAYTHSAGSGRGVTLYVPQGNDYPVPTDLDDSLHQYRGGVRIETSRFHFTIEQGAFQYEDNQRVYETQRNTGNRTTPFQGQTLVLNELQAQYGISGDAYFSRASVTANPFSWLDLFGNWTYSQPKTDVRYSENATGNFAAGLTFVPTQQLAYNAMSSQPHNRAHGGLELRPASRVRIIESIYTDRMHTASTVDRLEINYNQNQLELLFDPADRLTLRVGYRLTWGNSANRAPSLASFLGLEEGKLRRDTGLAGINYRIGQKFSMNLDTEVARSESAYFRTSLRNYERYRARVRYQALQSLSLAWSGAFLNNNNPNVWTRPSLGEYDLTTLDNSLSFVWNPKGGSRFRASGEYARSSWKSDILYLRPQDLTPERSLYRENGHAGTLMVDFVPARGAVKYVPRFGAGGSFFRSSGSRPTRYWQPTARAAVPIANHLEFIGEWRYWGLSQPFYLYEHFRVNQATFSLRFFN